MKLSHWEPDLRTLFNWIENKEIDLQPNFQRGDVWPSNKKKKLIDTILREWSIPPIHVVVTKSGTLEVLDGQQRLTAIRDFMLDGFPVDGSIEPIDSRTLSLSGLRYSQLPLPARRAFDQYTLRVFRITDYAPEEPGELFYRLNQQITLTAGEQRNAIFGPTRGQLKELVSLFEKLDNKRENIGFSNARLAYDDVFAKLLFFLEHKSFAEKATENRISDRFKLQTLFADEDIGRVTRAIERFTKARAFAKRVKLNKATLLSWLLFYCRFETEDFVPPHEFLSFFESIKDGIRSEIPFRQFGQTELLYKYKTNAFDQNALSLFIDRSSLRVSDISSVVYRDFALWAVYIHNDIGVVPSSVNSHDVNYIIDTFVERTDSTLEFTLDRVLNIERWARL